MTKRRSVRSILALLGVCLALGGCKQPSGSSAGNGEPQGAVSITLSPSDELETLTATGNAVSIAKNGGSLTITVSGGSFSDFEWIVDGATLPDISSSSISLSGTNYSSGGHSVTVYAYDGDGVPWSPAVPVKFTVTP
jgi:hypothetical protein